MSKEATTSKNSHEIGSAFDLLGKSYDIVKKNWQVFAAVNILSILSAIAVAFDFDKNDKNSWFMGGSWNASSGNDLGVILGLSAALIVVFGVIGLFLYAMSTSLQVKASAGKKPDLNELFEDGKKYFFRLLGVGILSSIIIVVGLILLIVPGIIAIGRLVMSPYHVVDKNLGVIDALKASNKQAIGRLGLVWAAIGVTILISILVSIINYVPIIGPLVGVAISIAYSLVMALRYQQLKKA